MLQTILFWSVFPLSKVSDAEHSKERSWCIFCPRSFHICSSFLSKGFCWSWPVFSLMSFLSSQFIRFWNIYMNQESFCFNSCSQWSDFVFLLVATCLLSQSHFQRDERVDLWIYLCENLCPWAWFMLVPNFWFFRSIVWFLLVPSVWFLLFLLAVSKCLILFVVHCLFHFLVHARSKCLVLSFHCLVLTCSKCLVLCLFHCLALSFQVLVHACFRVWLLACSPNVRFMFGSFPVQILYLISLVVLVSFPIYNLVALFTLDGSSFFSCSKYHVDFFVLNLHAAFIWKQMVFSGCGFDHQWFSSSRNSLS